MIFIINVTTNKEEIVLEMIRDRVERKSLPVCSLAKPRGLKGYLLLEVSEREVAEEAVFNIAYVKKILPKTVSYEEIKSMIEPKVAEIHIEKNDIVEIIAEPFKKEKAKVLRIDKQRGEAVITLLQAAIPIPVTVKIENLRVIRRDDEKPAEIKEEQE